MFWKDKKVGNVSHCYLCDTFCIAIVLVDNTHTERCVFPDVKTCMYTVRICVHMHSYHVNGSLYACIANTYLSYTRTYSFHSPYQLHTHVHTLGSYTNMYIYAFPMQLIDVKLVWFWKQN